MNLLNVSKDRGESNNTLPIIEQEIGQSFQAYCLEESYNHKGDALGIHLLWNQSCAAKSLWVLMQAQNVPTVTASEPADKPCL